MFFRTAQLPAILSLLLLASSSSSLAAPAPEPENFPQLTALPDGHSIGPFGPIPGAGGDRLIPPNFHRPTGSFPLPTIINKKLCFPIRLPPHHPDTGPIIVPKKTTAASATITKRSTKTTTITTNYAMVTSKIIKTYTTVVKKKHTYPKYSKFIKPTPKAVTTAKGAAGTGKPVTTHHGKPERVLTTISGTVYMCFTGNNGATGTGTTKVTKTRTAMVGGTGKPRMV